MISAITLHHRCGVVPEGTTINLTDPRGTPLKVVVFAGMPAGGRSYLLRTIFNAGSSERTLVRSPGMFVYVSDECEFAEEDEDSLWTRYPTPEEAEVADRRARWCARLCWDPDDMRLHRNSARSHVVVSKLPSPSFTGTILLDTPEVGLHPQVARGLMYLLTSEWPHGQVILATNESAAWDRVSSYARWFFAPPSDPRSSWAIPAEKQ